MRICQLIKLLSAFFLISCSSTNVVEKRDEGLISANWLKLPPRFSIRDNDDNYLTHPFFDAIPALNKQNATINYFITTAEDSAYKFNFDLYSGRLYKDHRYCSTEDVWESFKSDLERPNFTQGIVPRTYDKSNLPQRIIVFGNKNRGEKFKYHPTNVAEARLVGSVLLESCESYPCDTKAKWKGTQILIGVNIKDDHFSHVLELGQLKSKVDWNYFRAMMTNQDGVHQIGQKYFPAYRISKEINLAETLNLFAKESTNLKLEELSKWREGCFNLYDSLWENTEKIRNDPYDQQNKFLKLFKEFYKTSSDQFYACQKIVRPAAINDDARRLWFFTYIQAFTNLEKNGFYYSCAEKAWAYNPKVSDDRYYNDQVKELERCKGSYFEKSFDQAINGLLLMKRQVNKSFRFIEYDSEHGGSHQKIYAWVEDLGKSRVCKKAKNSTKENQFDLFPQDVVWQNFTSSEDKIVK